MFLTRIISAFIICSPIYLSSENAVAPYHVSMRTGQRLFAWDCQHFLFSKTLFFGWHMLLTNPYLSLLEITSTV